MTSKALNLSDEAILTAVTALLEDSLVRWNTVDAVLCVLSLLEGKIDVHETCRIAEHLPSAIRASARSDSTEAEIELEGDPLPNLGFAWASLTVPKLFAEVAAKCTGLLVIAETHMAKGSAVTPRQWRGHLESLRAKIRKAEEDVLSAIGSFK